MATFKDERPGPDLDDAQRYALIRGLLIGKYSVEVLPDPNDPNKVLFRVWFDQHCSPDDHSDISG